MAFRVSVPAFTVEADTLEEAHWRIARFFGKRSDGHPDDGEYETLGLDLSGPVVETDLDPPEPQPVDEDGNPIPVPDVVADPDAPDPAQTEVEVVAEVAAEATVDATPEG